jgi:hypothetical protein
MPEYGYDPNGMTTGSLTAYADAKPSARMEQVKHLDEALSRLELQVEQIASRIAPVLRQPEPMALAESDKAPEPNESDVVAHLRHTRNRVNGISDSLAELTARVDL